MCCVQPKISLFFSLDPDQKDALVEIIEKLLQDKTTVSLFYCEHCEF